MTELCVETETYIQIMMVVVVVDDDNVDDYL